MSNYSPISSSQGLIYPPSIEAGHREGDISNREATTSLVPPSLSSSLLGATVPAALKDAYSASTPQLEEPSLTNVTRQDISALSLLAQKLSQPSSASSTTPQAANSTVASQILAIVELYLQFQKNRYDESYAPGAPNAQETSNYQQEIESSAQSQIPIHVAATALGVQQSVDSTHTGTHHENTFQAPSNNITGSGSQPESTSEGVISNHLHENHSQTSTDPLNTATYSNKESLDALRKNLLNIGRSNILSSLNLMRDKTFQVRDEQSKIILSKEANMFAALEQSVSTLAEVTSKLRHKP